MFDGRISVVSDEGDSGAILSKTLLDGACLAAPSTAHGRVFVQTKKRLYCFGSAMPAPAFVAQPLEDTQGTGPAVSLQVIPAEFALKSGTSQEFKVYALDRTGRRIEEVKEGMAWEKWIPTTAKVQSMVDAEIDENGLLVADMGAKLSAGALRVSKGGVHGVTRGRILQDLPYEVTFEQGFDLKNTSSDDIAFSYPPLAWLGARMRWQIQKSGDNYLAGNTLDRVLFQRAINFVGHKDMSEYTMEADVMTDGDRRTKSNIGLINQRYVFALIGNGQKLEVFSNYDRFRHSVPFSVKTNVWYRLKTRVDLLADGTGMIRAKTWEKGSPEPSNWTIEVPHAMPHRNGAPGIYAMSPQSKKKVFFDNVSINYNK
jgi:hypothetical protein